MCRPSYGKWCWEEEGSYGYERFKEYAMRLWRHRVDHCEESQLEGKVVKDWVFQLSRNVLRTVLTRDVKNS